MKKGSLFRNAVLYSINSFKARHKGAEVISSTCLQPSWTEGGQDIHLLAQSQKKRNLCAWEWQKRGGLRKWKRSEWGEGGRGGTLESRAEGWSPKTSAHTSKSQTLWQARGRKGSEEGNRWGKQLTAAALTDQLVHLKIHSNPAPKSVGGCRSKMGRKKKIQLKECVCLCRSRRN